MTTTLAVTRGGTTDDGERVRVDPVNVGLGVDGGPGTGFGQGRKDRGR